MKKVSIVTLNGYSNYGNRLQLFALSKVLESLGCQTTVYWKRSIVNRIKCFAKTNVLTSRFFVKESKLKAFSKNNTPRVDNHIVADYCVVGSDQVWNPVCVLSNPYLLRPKNGGVLFSYAASVGIDRLTNDQKESFKYALKEYDMISVREESARQLLQPLTDKKISVVLDPTLLLDAEEYVRIEKKPRSLSEGDDYVLCYILGNNNYQNVINDFAKENGYRVIVFSDRRDSDYGVEEFLYLVHHAKLICTDSFHACVFSFLFERPFIVFRRSGKEIKMYSRIKNFVSLFHLGRQEYHGGAITSDVLRINNSDAKVILKKEREKAVDYLSTALGANDERE